MTAFTFDSLRIFSANSYSIKMVSGCLSVSGLISSFCMRPQVLDISVFYTSSYLDIKKKQLKTKINKYIQGTQRALKIHFIFKRRFPSQ